MALLKKKIKNRIYYYTETKRIKGKPSQRLIGLALACTYGWGIPFCRQHLLG